MIYHIKKILKEFPGLYASAQRLYPFATALRALFCGRRGAVDHLRSTWSLLCRAPFVAGLPVNITVEPTNVCNLRCPVCETGNNELGRAKRDMTLDEFRVIIKKIGGHTNTLMFYFMGEPFLNRDAYRMIHAAKEAGIPWVTACTNGEAVDPEQLVLSGIDEVSFQIGGISQQTHQIYRVNGNLNKALRNLRETVRLKRGHKSDVRIVCGMILMRHNEHEAGGFGQAMREIGVDEAVIVDPCVRTVEQGARYLPADKRRWYYDPAAFRAGKLIPRFIPRNTCHWIYYSAAVFSNGDVVPCCRDPKGEHVMGNLLKQDMSDIWNNEKYRAFRRAVLSNQSQMGICRLCSGYPASALK